VFIKSNKRVGWIFSNPLIFFLVYLTIHFLLRIFISETLQVDDREQILYAQTLEAGYLMPQPPMYSWLSWLFFKLFGSNLFALSLLKYILIYATFYFIVEIAKNFFSNSNIQKLVIYSFLLMPSFFWHMHQGFTHTILLGLGIVTSFYFFLLLTHDQSSKNFFLFGISVATGLLAKYSYILFLMTLLLSALTIKNYRDIILNKKFLISLSIILIIILPHVIWLISNYSEIFIQAQTRLAISDKNTNFLISSINFFGSFIGFISPLIFFMLYLIIKNQPLIKMNSSRIEHILTRNFYSLILLFSLIFLIFFEMENLKVRWLHPLMMLFPFFFFMFFDNKKTISKKFTNFYFGTVLFFVIFVIFVRVSQVTIFPLIGKNGRINMPITETILKIPEYIIKDSVIKIEDYDILAHSMDVFRKNKIIYNGKIFNDLNQNDQHCLILDSKSIQNFNSYESHGLISSNNEGSIYKIYFAKTNDKKCD